MKLARYLSAFVCLALVVGACGGPTASPASTASTAATAAAPTPGEAKTLQIITPWGNPADGDAFRKVLAGFTAKTGIEVKTEDVAEVLPPLTTRIAAGSPPDLAILPAASGVIDLAGQGALKPLNTHRDELLANVNEGWLDLLTIDGNIVGVPSRADLSGLLWFNPTAIDGKGPATWAEFTMYCDKVAAGGGACTAGLAKDTWTLSILFEGLYLSIAGPEKYNDLHTGKIPFTDPSVVEALNRVATYYSDKYAAGGRQGALGTGLIDGMTRVLGTTADAKFFTGGSWAGPVAKGAVNKDLVDGETLDYVTIPGEPAGQGAVVAQSDIAVILVDSPEANQLITYLISTEGQTLFTESGYTVSNKNVPASAFKGLNARTAELLGTSHIVSTQAALLSNELLGQFIEVVAAVVLDPTKIESLLETFQPNADAYFAR